MSQLCLLRAGASGQGIQATQDWKFAANKTLTSSQGITPSYSRASTATYFDVNGILQSAAINIPRFDHVYNAATGNWECRGLLIEEQRTNNLSYSDDISNAVWTKTATTVSANAILAPDGLTSADLVAEDGSTGLHQVSQLHTSSVSTYTFSLFVKWKSETTRNVALYPIAAAAAGSNRGVIFGSDGGFVALDGATGSVLSYSSVYCGGGWFRFSVTSQASTAGITSAAVARLVSGTTSSYTGDGNSGVYLWGAQLELGAFATSYIPTTSGSVTRSADVCQVTGGSFSGFWSAYPQSLAAEFDCNIAGTQPIAMVDDNTAANQAGLLVSTATPTQTATVASVAQVSTTVNALSANTTARFSAAFAVNDASFSVNGGASVPDATCTMPTVTMLRIGSNQAGNYLNGHIGRLRTFNKRLTDKQLEDLGRPELSKSLDLQFASTKSLTPLVGPTPSYSRASTGWYFNASGVLTQAAINEARFDHTFDGTNWVSRGLLIEEQRTNLLLNSTTLSTQNVTTSATAYTLSFYGTGTITLSGTSTAGPLVGTGANNRVTLTFTPTAGTLTLTVTGTVSNAQFEAGSFATSWISTAGTSATRSADVCTITGANFSGMWNASETSVVAKYGRAIPVNAGSSPFSLFGSSESTDLIYIYAPSGNESCRVFVGNAEQCGLVVGANPAAGSSVKTAFGIRANDFAASGNGGAVVTDASGTATVCTQMKIGYANSNYINSWVESLTLYTIRLPNRLLVTKSS